MSRRAAIARLYAVTPDLDDTALLLKKVEAALRGGAQLVQYRHKSASAALRRAQAAAIKRACDRFARPLIVNDDVELAHEIDAAGVHLGGEDAPVAETRSRLGPGKIIGASCYNTLKRAQDAIGKGADYVAFGSFFPSTVKPHAVKASVDVLMRAKRELGVPVVAIGGITPGNAPELVAAGADAVAVISALFDSNDIAAAAREFDALWSTHA